MSSGLVVGPASLDMVKTNEARIRKSDPSQLRFHHRNALTRKFLRVRAFVHRIEHIAVPFRRLWPLELESVK